MSDTPVLAPRHARAGFVLSLAVIAACQARARPESSVPAAPTEVAASEGRWMPSLAGVMAEAPAISLTASDGTGLRLVAVQARGWVEAPLALTELHLTFENPLARTIEGNFEVQLPPHAAVSRFGMKIDGLWQEGEVVERQAARRIFEDFLHRRQDPALLEHDAGERFRARVFPIPANGRKELVITYSQELAGAHASYHLPLGGLPKLDALDVRVLGPDPRDAKRVIELYTTRESAVEKLHAVVLREVGGPPDLGLRSGDLAVARITIAGDEAAVEGAPKAVTLLFDTSASQAGEFARKVAQLAALVERLGAVHGAGLPVRVWCFDQETSLVYRGAASGFSRAHTETILRRRALGASDLEKALTTVRASVQPGERVVIVGDGVATAGATDGGPLAQAVKQLRMVGVTRVDAVLVGGNRDGATMTKLAAADAGKHAGIVVDGSLATAEVVEKLRRPTFSGIHVAVPGSKWAWPERLDGVQPGDTVLVYAELPAEQALQVELDGGLASRRVATRMVERPLLERAWVGARIQRLLAIRGALPEGDADMRRAMYDQVVDLSRRHRVLSPFTGLLVLETEEDYVRYGIRRDALADILSVGDAGPELLRREGGELRVVRARDGATKEEDADADGEAGEGRPQGDTDGDGLPDADDRCPTVPETRNGYQDEDGCPDEIPMQLARFTGTIRGIYFDLNSAKIRTKSAPVLDRAIQVMREFPTIRIEVSGHCSVGEKVAVCGRRATAVRDYMVRKGIAAGRIDVRDGHADEPVDTNKTKPGRAKNRRIEFMILTDGTVWASPMFSAPKPAEASPHTGTFAEVMAAIIKDPGEAVVLATAWTDREPGNVLAVIGLGDALAAAGDRRAAARAYGSIIDFHPSRADLRRHAGQRLAALGEVGLALAIDTYAKAARQRPDHPTGHRLYAHALASAGRHREAFAAIVAGLREGQSRARSGVDAVLRADAAVLAAAYVARSPERRPEVETELVKWGVSLPRTPSTSFVLTWETDANDVDLHVYDGATGHASYASRHMPSGGALVADVTNGYGPEMFSIEGTPAAYPYRLEAHYFGQGPMGYGMGTLQVVEHDGEGRLRVDERPFVIMNTGARVQLGKLAAPAK